MKSPKNNKREIKVKAWAVLGKKDKKTYSFLALKNYLGIELPCIFFNKKSASEMKKSHYSFKIHSKAKIIPIIISLPSPKGKIKK